MTIHLTRDGEPMVASVLYNFNQLCNVILLRLHKTCLTDQDDIVLVYDIKNEKWCEIGGLENCEPLFFEQILSRLKNVLAEAQKHISTLKKDYACNEK